MNWLRILHWRLKGVKIGKNCIIEKDVKIGRCTVIRNNVEIRAATVIGEFCYIDSGVKMSGNCSIGDFVTLRYDVIIARGCVIGNDCYLSPRVMTNNLDKDGRKIGGAQIGNEVFIGTHTVINHGIRITDNVKIGAMSYVSRSITETGVYFGCPAKRRN